MRTTLYAMAYVATCILAGYAWAALAEGSDIVVGIIGALAIGWAIGVTAAVLTEER